ncbi:FAD-binding domain oxidoreductase [Medicago truncatula]|uniref:cytochrome-b5 reductase n=1 Tax=Medicago truncatula TaxID=3880 RepID=G7JVB4_MEDTR|nr:FAD-binding domain oxidoreductase [Medicago truncatula]
MGSSLWLLALANIGLLSIMGGVRPDFVCITVAHASSFWDGYGVLSGVSGVEGCLKVRFLGMTGGRSVVKVFDGISDKFHYGGLFGLNGGNRRYTPISDPEIKGYFDLLIKVYPKGRMTQHFASLKSGDVVQMTGYNPNIKKNICMIAGGTGINPMLLVIQIFYTVDNPTENWNGGVIWF